MFEHWPEGDSKISKIVVACATIEVMCNWGTEQEIVIEQRVKVDSCIAAEIVELNHQGVRTEGCCCGHLKGMAQALIRASSVDRARELGYDPVYYDNDNGLFGIKLRSERRRLRARSLVRL